MHLTEMIESILLLPGPLLVLHVTVTCIAANQFLPFILTQSSLTRMTQNKK